MKRIVALLLAVISLSGCVGQHMDEGLSNLVGQNISVAVARLGYPDSKREMMGDTIYVWGRSQNSVMPMSNTSTTTGMVGGAPVYGTTTSTSYVPVNYNCSIQIAVGANQIIKSWQWAGNMGGCSSYASALTRS